MNLTELELEKLLSEKKLGFQHFDGALFDTVLHAIGKAAGVVRKRNASITP